jgi:hypothetical protein
MSIPNPEDYADFDFGFTAADGDELNNLLGGSTSEDATSEQIKEIQDKLDLVLELNSTCEGAGAVKEQYDELIQAKMHEIEQVVLPLLVNLKKNKEKDYLFWPGSQRETQCDLQIEKLLNITRST